MAGPATILREIHRFRRHAKELESEIERGPRLLKTQQARITKQEGALGEAQETLKRLKVTTHEKEMELKATNQLIEKHRQQREQASSKKEYDALTHEIADDKKKCQDLEDEILNYLAQIDETTAQVPQFDRLVQQAKAEYAEFEMSTQSRQAALAEQLREVVQKIKEIEDTLPSDVRQQYDRLVAARGEDGMAAVENRTCMACYTGITAQNYNDLMLSQFLLCKSCGRALYLPE
jgi:predicted  nucleic acid-binding Zn-ribbon protein